MKIYCAMIGAALLSACSPYVYEAEVGKFSEGVAGLQAASKNGQAAIIQDTIDNIRFEAILLQKPNLTLSGSNCVFAEPDPFLPCHIKFDDRPVEFFKKQQIEGITGKVDGKRVKNSVKDILKALTSYSQGLVAITKAEDRNALDTATQSLAASAASVAALTPIDGGAIAAPIIGASVGFLGNISGAYLDARRHAVLRDVVLNMNTTKGGDEPGPALFLASELSEYYKRLKQQRTALLREQARNLRAGLERAVERGSDTGIAFAVDNLVAIAAELRDLNAVRPGAAVASFKKTHEALAKALMDDSRQVVPVATSASTFVEQATGLRDALDAAN